MPAILLFILKTLVVSGLAGLVFLALAWLFWRLSYGPPDPGQIPILAYHKVDDRFELGGTWITPGRFRKQMAWLRENDYQAVALSRAVELMQGGQSRKGKYVCLTFDDAYDGLYAQALPVLKESGFSATVFVITDFAGQENRWDINWGGQRFRHLDWDQMREMQRAGLEFGSHGISHRDLRHLSDSELTEELSSSRLVLERELGKPAATLSYPFGLYNNRVKEAARKAGYACACSLSPSHRNNVTDRFALRRCGVYITDIMWDFRHKVEQGSRWFWLQDLWSRTVNFCAGGTALAKRLLKH
jgi:peptidoglycan/xylan/chitin deacetylase (PgdA/CDA1 family)